jgi:hypothetical protein
MEVFLAHLTPPPLFGQLTGRGGQSDLKSNGDEALSDEFLLKSSGDEALNDLFL